METHSQQQFWGQRKNWEIASVVMVTEIETETAVIRPKPNRNRLKTKNPKP